MVSESSHWCQQFFPGLASRSVFPQVPPTDLAGFLVPATKLPETRWLLLCRKYRLFSLQLVLSPPTFLSNLPMAEPEPTLSRPSPVIGMRQGSSPPPLAWRLGPGTALSPRALLTGVAGDR